MQPGARGDRYNQPPVSGKVEKNPCFKNSNEMRVLLMNSLNICSSFKERLYHM